MRFLPEALRLFLVLSLLTGVAYPLLVTAIVQLTMSFQANGSFIEVNGQKVGSLLIGQEFKSEKYFRGRPSAIHYNPLPSGGSNLSWTSAELEKQINERLKTQSEPPDLLYSSASGLDPHISPEAARYQIDRIIKARGVDPIKGRNALEKVIEEHTVSPGFGFIGPRHVNVLLLNLAIDKEKW